MNELKIKLLDEKAGIPRYMTDGAAAMDLCARLDSPVVLAPGERALIPTGIAIGLQKGTVALIFARSGLAVKQGLCLSNGVGVIDSDYTGEIKVGLINLGGAAVEITDNMRVAQMMVSRFERVELCPVQELEKTERGDGGFGSTGTE